MIEPRIGILIINYNGRKWLSALYDSILADHYNNKRIYLIDNASEDESVKLTIEHYPEVIVIGMPRNLGYSMAYNLAMPHAFRDGCEWIIWSNSDVIVEPGCLGHLVSVANKDPNIGVIGPALLKWGSNEPNEFVKGNYPRVIPAMEAHSAEPIDVEWVEGSFPMVSRKCIQAIGCLDPYLHLGWEDADFCRRAWYRGWRVVLAPAARVHHYSGGWTKVSAENTSFHMRCRARNYYIYKLSNQNQSFHKNLLDATHLFLLKLKDSLLAGGGNMPAEVANFLEVLRRWEISSTKWRRDKAGEKPPQMRKDVPPVQVEVIQGKDFKASAW